MILSDALYGLTKPALLEALRDRTQEAIADLLLPTRPQKADPEEGERPADVYIGKLPDQKQAIKRAPYIIHQVVNSAHRQKPGEQLESKCTVRSIFCVYCEDEQEGALLLMNLMERMRISLLKDPLIGENRFECDFTEGLEDLVYPDDLYPYFCGEMITVWTLPTIKREVRYW